MAVVLHGYWRSLASYRVRAALNLKGVEYTETVVDLNQGEQFTPAYSGLNPQQLLPLLEHDGLKLTQSLAIVEYIDDAWQGPPLLPADAAGRARTRSLAQITIADVHPLIVPRVRQFLGSECGLDEPARMKWIHHWFDRGTEAIEARLTDGLSGRFAHGDQPSLADLALASHVAGARLFGCGLDRAPRLVAVVEHCMELDAFARAHPLAQPGAPTRRAERAIRGCAPPASRANKAASPGKPWRHRSRTG
jgi:maleylacetoacetate isomerase